MDAILISAKPSIVDVDDAIRHLETHPDLYWSVGFPIKRERYSYPIFAFIHVVGGQVEYRALVTDIVPFSLDRYEDPALRPEAWRNDPSKRQYPWKNSLVMKEIVPFSFETTKLEMYEGGLVPRPPQGFVRVIPPNAPREDLPTRTLKISLAERNLEDFVVQKLDQIESGLHLVDRQLSTPAGRLDLLCRDARGNYVVIELKRTRGSDQVVGQILRYMGWVKEKYFQESVRGIILVQQKDDRLQYAVSAVSGIEAKEFKVSIS